MSLEFPGINSLQIQVITKDFENWVHYWTTVKPRPEAHMDMILFEVFLKNIHLIPQDQIVQWHYI